MRKKIALIIVCAVLLTLVSSVTAIVSGIKNRKYQDALCSAENYCYELAQEQFLAMDGYKDSVEMAAEMDRLTEAYRTEVQNLFPGKTNSDQWVVNYWCEEYRMGLSVIWFDDNGRDAYATWSKKDTQYNDVEAERLFFGPTWNGLRYIRYDSAAEEYIFTQYAGEDLNSDMLSDKALPMAVQFRGKLNGDGSLTAYNENGQVFAFVPLSYNDYTSLDDVVLNTELNEKIKTERVKMIQTDFRKYIASGYNYMLPGGSIWYELTGANTCQVLLEKYKIHGEAPYAYENGQVTIDLEEWYSGKLIINFGDIDNNGMVSATIQCDELNLQTVVQIDCNVIPGM